ncbi:PTS sugar transporter subunit IIC [Vagococcus sp. PNs007]|uniref:Permease IIC component n=1 Tax=Vagococcus proximus TaxID=2991417 RepID=A0ABT5WZY6_9ENTE|nr:PTS sugar transporter subunit IIC [Vagococcus proximus]MDF0479315.1 PTS sugar transporter subunit IIC [Vagococcus proximus]
MDKFIAFMDAKFIPVASKIGAQRHLVAIRDSFVVTMPLMILGAFAVLINNLPIPAVQNFMNSIFSKQVEDGVYIWTKFGGNVWNGTFAILSVLIAFLVAYNLANSYGKNGISAGTTSLGAFFAFGGATGMSSNGLFIALIVGLISAELFCKLAGNDKLVIKMPDGVPPAVANSFAALMPAMITISLFGLINTFFMAFGIMDVVASFYAAVQEPFMKLSSSYPSALLLAFLTPFLWFFGLHGANMLEPLMQSINAPSIEANIKALEAGKELPYIVNKPFFDAFVNLGGTGATLGLVIAIFLVGKKHKQFSVVGKLGAAPSLFNINEPLTFGLPIVLNPILFIPYIITPMVLVTVAYFATSMGMVPAATGMPPWVTPPVIGGILATNSLSGGVLSAVNLVISVIIYVPFIKMATIQEMKKEAV